jgi:hypothetical protein
MIYVRPSQAANYPPIKQGPPSPSLHLHPFPRRRLHASQNPSSSRSNGQVLRRRSRLPRRRGRDGRHHGLRRRRRAGPRPGLRLGLRGRLGAARGVLRRGAPRVVPPPLLSVLLVFGSSSTAAAVCGVAVVD